MLIRLVLLLLSLAFVGGFFAFGVAEMSTTTKEIMIPSVMLSAGILAAALGYLLSSLRRR